ncbi:MAG TPA: hypothetical protein VHV54_10405 [Candidatus Binatia bacterium]|nr:hypothetical protein [Candidatus Binatia bacterium]
MTKNNKKQKHGRAKKRSPKRQSKRIIGPQTNQPFEQDSKRRIGQHGGAGEPPIMK